MITLITGLPGNAKTLFMLAFVKNKAHKEKREVYYSGIEILNKVELPWTEFKAENWMDCPEGAIIVMDEAQFVFEKKPNGASLPAHYSQLAVHRHKGFDMFVATQDPSLVDNFLRKLVGQHFHSVRNRFGFERSKIYEWAVCNPSPNSVNSQKSAITLLWSYPKQMYGWYKSAAVHTVKKRIPFKLVIAVLLVLVIVSGVYYKLTHFNHKKPVVEGVTPAPGAGGGSGSMLANSAGGRGSDKPFDPVADARQFVAMNTPRIQGLPQSAPKYDELTKPSRVPVPAACVQVGSAHPPPGQVPVCKCFTQQGTHMDVPLGMCMEFARNGFFQDFDPDRDRQQMDRTDRSQAILERSPVGSARPPGEGPQGGSSVIAFADVPDLPRARGAPVVQGPNSDGAPNGGRGFALPRPAGALP